MPKEKQFGFKDQNFNKCHPWYLQHRYPFRNNLGSHLQTGIFVWQMSVH